MEPYSCLHTYTYQGKPQFIKSVDLIFSPVRAVFKGKTVDLLNGNETVPVPSWVNSPQMKVATLLSIFALSIIFPPFGIAITTGLILKGICCLWEKKKVTAEIAHISEAILLFQENFKTKKYSESLSILEKKPGLAPRWKNELLVIGNQLALCENTLEHLPKLCEIYSNHHAPIRLFRYIVETKFKKDMLKFDLKHIEQWIKNLQLPNEEAIIYCNSILDLFKPEETDPFLNKMIKLNAGIRIIQLFEQYRQDLPCIYAENPAGNMDRSSDFLQCVQEKIKKPKNFDGKRIRNLLLSNLDATKSIYIQLLDSTTDCQHLSHLISAIRNVKNLEIEIDEVRPQLNENSFTPKNPVANLTYKKKIIAKAKSILQKIGTLHYEGKKQRKRLPSLSTPLISSFLSSKIKNIDSNCEFYNLSLNMAENFLTQSEDTLKFNAVKFKSAISNLAKQRYGEVGELCFDSSNPIHELYREYFCILRKQFDFANKIFDLVCLFDDLTIKQDGTF